MHLILSHVPIVLVSLSALSLDGLRRHHRFRANSLSDAPTRYLWCIETTLYNEIAAFYTSYQLSTAKGRSNASSDAGCHFAPAPQKLVKFPPLLSTNISLLSRPNPTLTQPLQLPISFLIFSPFHLVLPAH